MKLEDQVCSLELAKRLKSLGVSQESAFYWCLTTIGMKLVFQTETIAKGARLSYIYAIYGETGYECTDKDIFASAFTVAELGEMLPLGYVSYLHNKGHFPFWETCKIEENHVHFGTPHFHNDLRADTEANARAKMLIYLIEQGIAKP